MTRNRGAPPDSDRRSPFGRLGSDASRAIAGPPADIESDLPRLDGAILHYVDAYDRRHIGTIVALSTGKFAAIRAGLVLGYFETQQGALNRLQGRAPHEPPEHRGRP